MKTSEEKIKEALKNGTLKVITGVLEINGQIVYDSFGVEKKEYGDVIEVIPHLGCSYTALVDYMWELVMDNEQKTITSEFNGHIITIKPKRSPNG